ncbi:MAG: phosphatidate cytidylyltransferase [Candidatus Omnitrophica bacterium]|nr:phosphatidate cytidylyltransferase [Candidatus Omnitrophota bacterium]MDD5737175.1 phosphatidate cytidylyltransferase [Candidatus Omnitrophota bacterium]
MNQWLSGISATYQGMLLVIIFLVIASSAVWLLTVLKPNGQWSELVARTKSWWVMAAVFLAAIALDNRKFSILFFCILSLWATKEYLNIVRIPEWHKPAIIWSYIIIAMQYYWIMVDWYGMFLIFIPIYAFLFISTRIMLTNKPDLFLGTTAKIQWGLLAFGLGLSHLGYLINTPEYASLKIDGRTLLLFLVIMTELNDVAQYFWGKLLGKHKILSLVSPKKTWEGFVGGIITVVFVGFAINFLSPFKTFREIVLVSFVISICGFFGDVVMSAIKRDLSVKDFSAAIPGHGGILDRIDSICFTAPVFFHIIRYWYWPAG